MHFYNSKAGRNTHDFILAQISRAEGKQKTRFEINTEYCTFASGKKFVDGLDGAVIEARELAEAKVVAHLRVIPSKSKVITS
jgi:hypothetical protein